MKAKTQYITIPLVPKDDPDPTNPYWRVVVEPPRRRDWLAVLRGRYQPRAALGVIINVKRGDKILREVWLGEGNLKEALNQKTAFLEGMEQDK